MRQQDEQLPQSRPSLEELTQIVADQRAELDRMLEAEAVRARFMQIVSHELRTPLAVVMGFSETLALRADRLDTQQIVEIASRTHAAAARLERLITDLVGVSQVERGKLAVEPAPTSLGSILDQVTFAVEAPSHPFEVEMEPDLPDILVDRDRAIQVIDNIVVNARKFSPAGSPIRLTAWKEGEAVALSIQDRGPGIAPEDRDRVFDPFFQADQTSTRSSGGLGIGLYLVKQICTLMDSEVSLDPEVEQGARFIIRFPHAGAPADGEKSG